MPRLGHKKSRNGCRQCKARHVKCDENKPCSNCARHGVLCSLVDPNAVPTVPTPSSSSSSAAPRKATNTLVERPKKATPESQQSAASSQTLEFVLNPSPSATAGTGTSEADSPQSGSDTFPFITKFVHRREPVQANLWLRDLELLHHWMIEGIDSFSQKDACRHMWRTAAVTEALIHNFLMHEILAFCAFHIARLRSDQRVEYYDLGVHHQDHALRGMRRALKNITVDNASSLFAASTLITVSVMASRGFEAELVVENIQKVFDDLIDVFQLVKGIGGVLTASQISIINGPFRPIFVDGNQETPSQPIFVRLIERLPALTSFMEAQESIDGELRREFISYIGMMRDHLLWASKPCSDNREMRFLFYWPLNLGGNFFDLVRQQHEGALVLLMHWAVVLHAADSIHWFLHGWADRVRSAISAAVVDPEWRSGMEWPLQLMEAQAQARATPPQGILPGTAI